MMSEAMDLEDGFLPLAPVDEIPRDGQLRRIAGAFGPACQAQVVVGPVQSGKTNLLAQFCRYFHGQTIGVDITDSPWSQSQHAFLYAMCYQLSRILGKNTPQEHSTLEQLKALFTALDTGLAARARERRLTYYYVVDGLEWALEGATGDRIIDLLPFRTHTHSPYMLCSCRSDRLDQLPVSMRCPTVELWPFSIHETQKYLAELNLTDEQVVRLHKKYDGIPGYLTIIKQTKLSNPNIAIEAAPVDLDKLIMQQLEYTFKAIDDSTMKALEMLAVSPMPLPMPVLAQVVAANDAALSTALECTGLTRRDPEGRIGYRCDLMREKHRQSVDCRAKQLLSELITHLREGEGGEGLLLALLHKEVEDYTGLQQLLTTDRIVAGVDATGDLLGVIRRLQLASEMARARADLDGLVRWTLGIAAAKAFISHAVGESEIRALIALGEIEAALRKAYAMPEVTSRIRLLARAYQSMKERGERVSREQKEELAALVADLRPEETEEDIIEGIALDLLPILPDVAISLLEKMLGHRGDQGIAELTSGADVGVHGDLGEDISLILEENLAGEADLADLLSGWLRSMPIAKLLEELKSVEKTRAREYMIRQWCRQNLESPDVARALDLWLDAVEGDRAFIIPLRSLRHMSEVAAVVPLAERKRLVARIMVPRFLAIDSPHEEWIRLRLNLVEAQFPVDAVASWRELEDVRNDINGKIKDLDEKAYGFARLKLTVAKIAPENRELLAVIEEDFQKTFDALRGNSAEQFQATRGILRTLVAIDPSDALIVASELNTRHRRIAAYRLVLMTALRRRGQEDLAGLISDVMSELGKLDVSARDVVLAEVVSDVRVREVALNLANLKVFLKSSEDMRDHAFRADALASLAVLCHRAKSDQVESVTQQALEQWRAEEDLRVRLSLGFRIVETLSKVDPEGARTLCDEVQDLHLQPGACIAAGAMGPMFRGMLDLAIRSTTNTLFAEESVVQRILRMIEWIPAQGARAELYAKLAAAAYRSGSTQCASDLVRLRVIPEVRGMPVGAGRDAAMRSVLPVVHEYDPSEAESLIADVPSASATRAWYSVVLWSLSRSHFGDHLFAPDSLRVPSDHPRLQRVLRAMAHIEQDHTLYDAISAVAQAVHHSYITGMIDSTQALDIVSSLDAEAESRLPDLESISHEGYLVVSFAAAHRIRCSILDREGYRRQLKKRDLDNRWQEIEKKARSIPNSADRVYVLSLVARERAQIEDRIRQPVEMVLDEAYGQVDSIPILRDRLDRIESIAETWQYGGDSQRARALLNTMVNQIGGLADADQDAILSSAVEVAYKVSPEFADELVSRADTRSVGMPSSSADIALRVRRILGNPSVVGASLAPGPAQSAALQASAREMLEGLAAGKEVIRSEPALLDWLMVSQVYEPGPILTVANWVVETRQRKRSSRPDTDVTTELLDVAQLTYRLAQWISSRGRDGLPISMQDSFAGFNPKVVVFQAGERQRATRWVQQWLTEHVADYLKICDPYFGPEELAYLACVPPDSRVLIITTDKYLDKTRNAEELRDYLRSVWGRICTQDAPHTQIMVVPSRFEDKFHDRAVVTRHGGLSLGQSLNGLGKARGTVTALSSDDAQELEATYLDVMLNQATWFMQHGLSPRVVILP